MGLACMKTVVVSARGLLCRHWLHSYIDILPRTLTLHTLLHADVQKRFSKDGVWSKADAKMYGERGGGVERVGNKLLSLRTDDHIKVTNAQ